ncbi:macrophage mannose receptor 1-like [Asterias rubens]|uniref:macrophage mannose receptor 1-like n=1 Tax=Asterias rubens TaxID=7604 RepID=UPI001455C01D|nr:macrophage mannose receptor 1-like [Asterias rubens]
MTRKLDQSDPEMVKSVTADGGCAAPFLRLFDKCYGLFGIEIDGTPRLSWHKAEKYCNEQGGTLAVIDSREVQSVITALLVRAPSANVWIGLNDLDVENTFKWTDGTNISFKNWAPDQPDNGFPAFEEDCVYLESNEDFPGEWNDGFCDYNREYICQIPLDPTIPDVPTRYCQNHRDYTPYHRSCFKIFPDAKNFSEAVSVCEEDGTIIASIDDAFQEAFVETLLMNDKVTDVWLGLQTRRTLDYLSWVDSHPVTYTNWDLDYPKTTMECAILSENNLKWRDERCDESHPVICKHFMGQPPPVVGLPPSSDCPAGMDPGDEWYCLKIEPDESVSYEDAKAACEAIHSTASLASVHNKHELTQISQSANTTNPLWIGLHKANRGQLAWEDGSAVDYVSFAGGEPHGDGEDCIQMQSIAAGSTDAEWSTFRCIDVGGYVCRSPIILKPPSKGGCLDGWYNLGNRCYKAVGIEDIDRLDFKDAQDQCAREKGGQLFQITTQSAQSLLALLLQDFVGKTNLWIGLSDTAEEGSFVWTDGTPLDDFTQWAPNQPDGFIALPNEPFRDCVEVKADPDHPGEWDDVNCRERRGYICEAFWRPELDPNPINPDKCDAEHSDYVKYRNSCFKIIQEKVTYDDARQKCLDENATLAKASDGFSNALMTLMVTELTLTEKVWISLAKDLIDDKYTWRPGNYDGEWPLEYVHWGKGMPDGKGCTLLNPDSTWSTVDCDTTEVYYPMCEYTEEIPDEPPIEEVHCPEGWVLIDRMCYIFTTITPQYPKVHFTWDEAEYECRTRYSRSTLPSLHSLSASQKFADNAFRQLGRRNIWLGLHRSVNGFYVWDDGSLVDYVNWDLNSIDEANDCMGLQQDLGGGKWSSRDCFTTGGLACQAPALPGRPNLCPSPWQSPGGVLYPNCYLMSGISESSWMSWHEATSYCNQKGGYLTSMNPREEYVFILNMVKGSTESHWIGLNDIDVPGTWVWQDGTAYNGAPSLWSRDDIRNEFNMEACVVANSKGLWEDHNCGIRRPFICKWDPTVKDPIVPTQTPYEGGCEPGSYRLKDRCYDLRYADYEYTWMQAHSQCIANGGHLAAIHDHGVQALLSSVLKNLQGNVWIGLSRFGEFQQYYWSDGATSSYTNWALGEPNGPQQQEGVKIDYCAEMVNNPNYAGKWNDVDCTKKNGFVCQKALDESITPEDLPFKLCPSNSEYIVYEGNCFKVAQVASTHGTARDKCEEDGATLASVADGYEQAFIEMLMVYYNIETAWIGLTRGENDQFEWIDDWPVVYTGWGVGYPASSSDVNRCVISSTQGWRNVGCYDAYGAVCKINQAPKPSAPQPPSGHCQAGWSLIGDTCLFFDTEVTSVSYVEGMAFCRAMGPNAFPASVHDSVFNNILRSNALNQLGVENVWLGLVYQNGEFTWADGSPVDYTNWGGDQPSMPITGEICVQMAAEGYGVWKNTDCFVKAGYICQAPRGDIPPSTTSTPTLGFTHPPEPEQAFSTGKIVGIAIGSGVGFVVLVSIFCYYREKKSSRDRDELL